MPELSTARQLGADVADLLRLAPPRADDFYDRKVEDHRAFTAAMMFMLGPMAASMWVFDYIIDPIGARSTLGLRLLCLLLGLIPAVVFVKARNRHVMQVATVLALATGVVVFMLITARLQSNSVFVLGGYMFFSLAVLLLCQGFSAEFGVVCAVGAGVLPHLLAWLGVAPGFQHLQYAMLIWPAVGMSCVAVLALGYNYGALYDTRRTLELVSAVDPLTEAANRRLFMPLLEKEMARSKRFGHPLSLLMIDIDRFKLVNDEYGHPVGDIVLRQLADTCRAAIRESDTLARLGGDEFAVLLPETDAAGALALAETVRAAVESSPALGPDAHAVRYTVSIGAVQSRLTDIKDTSLIGRADTALYEAKQAGRNRVCCGPALARDARVPLVS